MDLLRGCCIRLDLIPGSGVPGVPATPTSPFSPLSPAPGREEQAQQHCHTGFTSCHRFTAIELCETYQRNIPNTASMLVPI